MNGVSSNVGRHNCTLLYLYVSIERVNVKCNQTGKIIKAKLTSLSREDTESLTASDLKKGSQLLLESNKKSYPVTVQKVVTINSDSEGMCFNNLSICMYYPYATNSTASGSKRKKSSEDDLAEILSDAKDSVRLDQSASTQCS